MQEACQFHSLAVNCHFSDSEIIFQSDFCEQVGKIPDYGKIFIPESGAVGVASLQRLR